MASYQWKKKTKAGDCYQNCGHYCDKTDNEVVKSYKLICERNAQELKATQG